MDDSAGTFGGAPVTRGGMGAASADASTLLLEFVRERDVECPRCGYNLRNLTRPVCPECGNALHLKVGSARVQIAMFLLTVVPGIFSGMAAALLTGSGIYSMLFRGRVNRLPIPLWGALVFGWISAIVAGTLYWRRERFLRQSKGVQCIWALSVWLAHLAAFAVFAYFMA